MEKLALIIDELLHNYTLEEQDLILFAIQNTFNIGFD
jgi:hypothetical protein